MPMSASRSSELAYSFLYVALAGVGAILLFQFVLEQYAMARFWEHWIAEYPVVGTYLPFCVIAVASGVLIGLVLGLLVRTKALALSAWAGFGVCVLSFVAASAAGGIQWAVTNVALIAPPAIASGLFL